MANSVRWGYAPAGNSAIISCATSDRLIVEGQAGFYVEEGQVTPVIDPTYPLEQVAAAMGHLEAGHARGKIAITI